MLSRGAVYARPAAWPWRVAYVLSAFVALALPWILLGPALVALEPAAWLASHGVGPWLGLRIDPRPWPELVVFGSLWSAPVLWFAVLVALGGRRAPPTPARSHPPRFGALLAVAGSACWFVVWVSLLGGTPRAIFTPLAPVLPASALEGSALAALAALILLPLGVHLALRRALERVGCEVQVGGGVVALRSGRGPVRVLPLEEVGPRRPVRGGIELRAGAERFVLPLPTGGSPEWAARAFSWLDACDDPDQVTVVELPAERWSAAVEPTLVLGAAAAAFLLQGVAWVAPVVGLGLLLCWPGRWLLRRHARRELRAPRVRLSPSGLLGSRWLAWDDLARVGWGQGWVALRTRAGERLSLSLEGWSASAREALRAHLSEVPRESGELARAPSRRAGILTLRAGVLCLAALLVWPPLVPWTAQRAYGHEVSPPLAQEGSANDYVLVSFPFQRGGVLLAGGLGGPENSPKLTALLAGDLPPGVSRGSVFAVAQGAIQGETSGIPAGLAEDLWWDLLVNGGYGYGVIMRGPPPPPFERRLPREGAFWENLAAGRTGRASFACGEGRERLRWYVEGGQVVSVCLLADGARRHPWVTVEERGLEWLGLPQVVSVTSWGGARHTVHEARGVAFAGEPPSHETLLEIARRVQGGATLSAAAGSALPFWRWESAELSASSARSLAFLVATSDWGATPPSWYRYHHREPVDARYLVPEGVRHDLEHLLQRALPERAGRLCSALSSLGEGGVSPAQRDRLEALLVPAQLELVRSPSVAAQLAGLRSIAQRLHLAPPLRDALLATSAHEQDPNEVVLLWDLYVDLLAARLPVDASLLPRVLEALRIAHERGRPTRTLVEACRPAWHGAVARLDLATAFEIEAALARCGVDPRKRPRSPQEHSEDWRSLTTRWLLFGNPEAGGAWAARYLQGAAAERTLAQLALRDLVRRRPELRRRWNWPPWLEQVLQAGRSLPSDLAAPR